MKLQLFNPPPFQRVESAHDTPDYTRLGLACLAAYLRDAGHELDIVDCKFEQLGYEQAVERALAFRPDVVGVTAFTNEVLQAARLARAIRRTAPEIKLVLGGVHLTTRPAATLAELPAFDFGVVGEGERVLAGLLASLAAGETPAEVAGVVWRDGPRVVVNDPPPSLDLARLPLPAWDLLPPSPEYLVMISKGCPYRCPFCVNPNGRRVRPRSAAQVIEELQLLAARPNSERLLFCDEVFGIDRATTDAVLDGMIATGVARRLRSFAQTHVNVASLALFRKMKQAGFYGVGLGIETGDARAMAQLGKGLRLDRVVAARSAAQQAGLEVEGFFILGHPGETVSSALRTVRLAIALNPDIPIFGLMVPYPGTAVAEMAERGEGGYRLQARDWNDFNKQIGDALAFEHLSRTQLELLQVLGYLGVFVGNRRFVELGRFIWRFRSEAVAVLKKILGATLARS